MGAITVGLAPFERDPYGGIGGGSSAADAVDNGLTFCQAARVMTHGTWY